MADLETALDGDVMDLLDIGIMNTFSGRDAEDIKALRMTYGEFFGLNLFMHEWLEYLLIEGLSDDKTDEEWEDLCTEADAFAISVFIKRLKEKRDVE